MAVATAVVTGQRIVVAAAVAAAMVLGTTGAGRAQEIYQWRDKAGNAHFTNVPTTDSAPTGLRDEPAAGPAQAPGENDVGEGGDAAQARTTEAAAENAAEEDAAYSSDASTKRSGLEHQLRDAQRRIRDADSKLAGLAHARTRHAQGSDATGGLGTSAGNTQSDEERTLTEERERQTKRLETLRGSYGQLHDDVTAHLGTTPAWWIDVH